MTLYCGYVYVRALIADSFQTAAPAALAFATGVLLLTLFTLGIWRGTADLGPLCGGLTAFFWLTGRRRMAVGLLARAQGVTAAQIVMQITEQLTPGISIA